MVNPIGRYWDRCFVALVETIHAPAALPDLPAGTPSDVLLRRPDGELVRLPTRTENVLAAAVSN